MSEISFNRDDFPNPLVTAEDYEKACDDFVVPYTAQQASLIGVETEELHEYIKNNKDDLDQEVLDAHLAAIQSAAKFTDPNVKGPIYDFMQEVIALETKLQGEGVFDEVSELERKLEAEGAFDEES